MKFLVKIEVCGVGYRNFHQIYSSEISKPYSYPIQVIFWAIRIYSRSSLSSFQEARASLPSFCEPFPSELE